jgi:hypothetical protein
MPQLHQIHTAESFKHHIVILQLKFSTYIEAKMQYHVHMSLPKINPVSDNDYNILSYISCRALQMTPTDSSVWITRPESITVWRPFYGHFRW